MDQDASGWKSLLTRANQLVRSATHPPAELPVEGHLPGEVTFADPGVQAYAFTFGWVGEESKRTCSPKGGEMPPTISRGFRGRRDDAPSDSDRREGERWTL